MTNTATPPSHVSLRGDLVGLISDVMRRDPADPVDLQSITDATPCLGGPLLLDSLDVLELVVSVDRVYGASLRDGDIGRKVLADMGSLTRFVAENRTR